MANTKKGLISRKKMELFLLNLSRTGHIEDSCHAVGYADSSYIRKVRNKDSKFAAKWDAALLVAAEIKRTLDPKDIISRGRYNPPLELSRRIRTLVCDLPETRMAPF